MMDQFLAHIHVIADTPASLFAVLFASSLGNAVFPPIPIEFATLFAGYLVSTGHGSLPVTVLATTLGMTLGSLALYFAARRYGTSLMQRRPFSRIVLPGTFERASAWARQYGVWSLFLAKFVPGMNFCAILCCGVLRLGRMRALLGIFFSNLLAFGGLAVMGKLAGEHWREVYVLAGKMTALLLGLAVAALFVILYVRSLAGRPNKQKTG